MSSPTSASAVPSPAGARRASESAPGQVVQHHAEQRAGRRGSSPLAQKAVALPKRRASGGEGATWMAHTTIPLRAPQDKERSDAGLAPKRSTTSQRPTTNAIHAPESPRRPTRPARAPPRQVVQHHTEQRAGRRGFSPLAHKSGRSAQAAGVRGARAQRGWLIPPSPSEHPKTRRAAP
jgi:hypothetical protein